MNFVALLLIIQLTEERQLPFAMKFTDFTEKATKLELSEQQYLFFSQKNVVI